MTDFNALLSAPAESAKQPPSVPPGSWRMQILKYEFVKQGKKQTDAVSYTMKLLAPEADVDAQDLETFREFYGGDFGQRTTSVSFWLTQDALFRLKDFLVNVCRLDGSKSFKELLAESVNSEVIGKFTQQPSSKDPTRMVTFVNADDLAPIPG